MIFFRIRIRHFRLFLPVLRIRDVYHGSWFLPIPDLGSRIPDPKTATKERWKKISCHTFLCSHKFHKIVNFSFEVLKKKIWASFQRIIELFTKKIVKKLLKIRSWDPGSEIRKKPIPDPGSRGQKAPNPGSRIRIRNTGFYHKIYGQKCLLWSDTDPQNWILVHIRQQFFL